MSRIGFHPDGLCDQCDLPETVEHVIQVCPKHSAARQRLQHALNQIGVTFHPREILLSRAAAMHVETFVRESGIRIQISFYPALALQDPAVRKCHLSSYNSNNNNNNFVEAGSV